MEIPELITYLDIETDCVFGQNLRIITISTGEEAHE